MLKIAKSAGITIMLAMSAGCATDDYPTSTNGGGGGVDSVSFSADIQPIFDGMAGCTGSSCHGVATQAGLDLRMGNSYADLYNVMSSQTNIILVVPFKADSSFLVHKLEGTQGGVGSQMPVGLPALDSLDVQKIRDWIDDGALDN